MTTVTYTVPNISCMHCVHTIKTELQDLKGVQTVEADASSKLVKVTYEPPATEEAIEGLLEEINYPAAK